MTTPRSRARPRRGFTLIEVMIAMVILSGVVLSIAVGTTKLQRAVGDANVRSRAFARADQVIGLARTWPAWSTLEQLAGARYNPSSDGFTSTTTVTADTTGGRRIKRLEVTVRAVPSTLMPLPVRRSISITAP
ncbi:MAG: prepilin-type N-terminal cleavage/methylation domain-containing protein [Gemmatimonadetes bacterium]|nr:prepilin-type N-terminal cleavage/methylation domain-containing protein [Gemmatimonadota bacterium]